MKQYKIDYEILTLEKLQKRIEGIISNPENRFKATKLENIGYTTCGFPIEHYSIGSGPLHITYMGGAHGNEIISVDFVTQLMKNLSLGNDFSNFDPEVFTIDFIPVQNPEGFAVTTYALDSIMKNMNIEEIERFSKHYWQLLKIDDQNVLKINRLLKLISEENKLQIDLDSFWLYFQNKDITKKAILNYLTGKYPLEVNKLALLIEKTLNFDIPKDRKHTDVFNKVTPECIPEISAAHSKLKEKIIKMYTNNVFPYGTLANFYANSNGVNLNDNNPEYYQFIKNKINEYGKVLGNLRDNHITKSITGPIGMPNHNMNEKFKYEAENIAILNYLYELEHSGDNMAFFNCHGTGGLLYIYPVFDNEVDNKIIPRDFSFFINNRLATEYVKTIGEVYKQETNIFDPYKTMGHPEKITGVGDLLRQKYIASFIVELSKMGGNPIAPYGDKEGNYYLTMISNFKAFNKTLETVLELRHLYDIEYEMSYDEFGKVHYKKSLRKW